MRYLLQVRTGDEGQDFDSLYSTFHVAWMEYVNYCKQLPDAEVTLVWRGRGEAYACPDRIIERRFV